ncbi:MAG: Ku protein [Dissulfurispiraceae bacterium]
MKAIWKGHIRFSLVTIPILVYNAVDSEQSIRFNLLHKDDHGLIGYDKRCKKCNKLLNSADIVKGFKYEPERYVVVEEGDLDKIHLKSTRIIEIEGFIDSKEVHPTLFEMPYYAGPDGPVAVQAYAILAAALKETGKTGIGKVVLHDREDVVMIAPYDKVIVLYKLRSPAEIRSIANIPLVEDIRIDREKLKLASSLVNSMTTKLDKLDLTDKYHDSVRTMIEAKIAGKEIVTVEEIEKPVVDIMTALKKSIEQAKSQRKPMEKATGKKKAVIEKESKSKSRAAV